MANRIKTIISNLQEHESQTPTNSDRVTTEGDELYYEVRGQGQPLLMIPGSGGDGGSYSLVAEILSDEYKIIAYDRRANARSTMNDPQNFEVSQQSRDAVAVLRAAGETSAFVLATAAARSLLLIWLRLTPSQSRRLWRMSHRSHVCIQIPGNGNVFLRESTIRHSGMGPLWRCLDLPLGSRYLITLSDRR
jgi:hypothetical protein